MMVFKYLIMNIKRFSVLSVLSALLFPVMLSAQIQLPEQFSDRMVLQQNSDCAVWGWASEGASVSVSFNGKTVRTNAGKDGRWDVKVHTPSASYKPYQIKVKGDGSNIVINDVLVGEVWFASGQSNMDMQIKGYFNCPVEGVEEVFSERPMRNEIRIIKFDRKMSLKPENFCTSTGWMAADPSTVGEMSAVCYFFARKIQPILDVPVGIVDCSYGGTRIESWLPMDVVKGYGTEPVDYDTFKNYWTYDFLYPAMMYNAMYNTVKGYTVKGFIWYQGCSNLGFHDQFVGRMSDLVRIWRNDFGDTEDKLPFYMTEVAPFCREEPNIPTCNSALLRKAQHDAAKAIPNSGTIVTDDLAYTYERYQIHPCQKRQVGERLAFYALNRDYGFSQISCESPEAVSVSREGNQLVVVMKNLFNGLNLTNGVKGLEICGPDHVWVRVNDIICDPNGPSLRVFCDQVPEPVAVKYCWADFAPGNLKACNGLPVAPFYLTIEE